MIDFPSFDFQLDKLIDHFVKWLTADWRFHFFRGVSATILWPLVRLEKFLQWLPVTAIILAVALLAWWSVRHKRTRKELFIVLAEAAAIGLGLTFIGLAQEQSASNGAWEWAGRALLATAMAIAGGFWAVGGRQPGLPELAMAGFMFIGVVGLWDAAMTTLAVVGVATTIAIMVAIPTGIVMAKSDRLQAGIRPILDLLQTMPSFVYLVPALMLFGLGKVPAIMATVMYAVAPGIRLTNLGIRLVDKELIEAAHAFGTAPRQMLFKVELPLALPTIMAGINQVIMASLAMVVIASMVGAAGLGIEVLHGIARLKVGQGFNGGLSITLLAIIIDRVTRGLQPGRESAGEPA